MIRCGMILSSSIIFAHFLRPQAHALKTLLKAGYLLWLHPDLSERYT